MIKFTTHKYHLPWICFNHSLKAEAIDATYNKQTSTWTAADQQQSEGIHFLLSLKTFEPHSEVFFKFYVAFCHCASVATASNSQKDAQWWITQQTRPVLLFSLLQRQLWAAWNKLSNLLPLPWLSVQWIETGLPEMAFLKQETKTWFTLQNVCVCTHRLKWLLTSRSKNDEMGFKLMAVNTVEPFSYSHVFTTYLVSKLPARCYVCARHCKHQRSIKMSFTLSELTAVEDTYGYKKKK